MDDALYYAWAPKAAVYCLGQLAIGIGVAGWLERLTRGDHGSSTAFQRWLGQLARAVSGLLLVSLTFRLLMQTASAFGLDDLWAGDNLRIVAIESRWGNGWRLQAWAAAGMLGTVLLWPARLAWVTFATCAVGLALAMPALGHAAGNPARMVLHGLHILGAAAWLGTLGVVTLTAWLRPGFEASVTTLLRRFSPVALVSAATVSASGLIAAWTYVGSWAAMWTTPYGRVLLAKLVGVAIILACGLANWRNAQRGKPPRRAILTLEWVAALFVIGATGALTEAEHP